MALAECRPSHGESGHRAFLGLFVGVRQRIPGLAGGVRYQPEALANACIRRGQAVVSHWIDGRHRNTLADASGWYLSMRESAGAPLRRALRLAAIQGMYITPPTI